MKIDDDEKSIRVETAKTVENICFSTTICGDFAFCDICHVRLYGLIHRLLDVDVNCALRFE